MRDLHCHKLPGVDDGAQDIEESLAMLEAAKKAGITEIVCTPHCRDPYFDYDAMCAAYDELVAHAGDFPLTMGFEVNYAKLVDLGMEWADKLAFRSSSREFLLELPTHAQPYHFKEYESVIFQLQACGYEVIIAHPERYQAVQKDMEIARNLVRMGCKLQVSSNFVAGGRLGSERKPAKRLFKEGIVSYIASDAHCVEHYRYFAEACANYRTCGKHARF